jgi:rhodanese-related sulfurtransferase
VVDARSGAEFEAWHHPRARSIPFDYLEPVSKAHLDALLAARASAIVVYGDGADPDSGQELAKELAGLGLRNVFFVQGGAPALGGAEGK